MVSGTCGCIGCQDLPDFSLNLHKNFDEENGDSSNKSILTKNVKNICDLKNCGVSTNFDTPQMCSDIVPI